MILREPCPGLLVLKENRTNTTITTHKNALLQEQRKTSVSQATLEVSLLGDNISDIEKNYCEKQITNIASKRGGNSTSKNEKDFLKIETIRSNEPKRAAERRRAETSDEGELFSMPISKCKAISINDNPVEGKSPTFYQLLNSNQCQQVATVKGGAVNPQLQSELVPTTFVVRVENSFPTDRESNNLLQNNEVRASREGERSRRRKSRGGSTQVIVKPNESSSKKQMNHCPDIEGSSTNLSIVTRASDASSIELDDKDLQARVLYEEIRFDKRKQLSKLRQRQHQQQHNHHHHQKQRQLLQHCSFERNIQKQQQKQHEQQSFCHFRQKHCDNRIDRVCSRCQNTGHRWRRGLMVVEASDYNCYSDKPKSLRLMATRLILFLCLVPPIRTNFNNNSNSGSSSSFFRSNNDVFLSLGLVEASNDNTIKIGSLSPNIHQISSSEKISSNNLTQLQVDTSHELSKLILRRISRQHDYDDSTKSHSSTPNNPSNRLNNSDSDNEHESLLSPSDYDSNYNSGGSVNDPDEDSSKILKYFDTTSSTSNQASGQNEGDVGENYIGSQTAGSGSVARGDMKSFFDRATTTNNQSKFGATMFENRFENDNSSSTLIGSLFSHIDKQWNFAEVILIIVISAILNLVTIIGNIMVLISFKMDRS